VTISSIWYGSTLNATGLTSSAIFNAKKKSENTIFQKITTIVFNTHLWILSYLLLLINSDVTESEVVSIPSIYARGHFRNDFVKPSDIFVLLALLLLLRSQEGKFQSSFAL